MRSVLLILACLACESHTRALPKGHAERQAAEMNALALLLRSLDRAAAYNPSSTGLQLRARQPARAGVSPRMEVVENPTATFTTSMGEFTAEIYLKEMPLTASNFIDLCSQAFYDKLHFHRVKPGFMAQTGCPRSSDPQSAQAGEGGPENESDFKNLVTGGYVIRKGSRMDRQGFIQDEFTEKISNEPFTIAMANNGRPNTGGSQFFINMAHNKALDWFDDSSKSKHPVFGKVIEGMDVVEKIVNVERDDDDRPVEPVKLEKVRVSEIKTS
mmetsp:Transcript_58069/g.106800  ORF Transcript_58069/g.106800 Transcript_58069/m.106800 type:complete len:271 (-) Transcript_58069:172-984(-)